MALIEVFINLSLKPFGYDFETSGLILLIMTLLDTGFCSNQR